MKDVKFHRDIPPLSFWEASGLIALAQTLRDTLTPGCDCAGIQAWGHTALCRIRQEYMREAEQRLNESVELRMTWECGKTWPMYGPEKRGFDLQIYIPQEFRPSGAGWVGFIQL